jgi:hypothetical protein
MSIWELNVEFLAVYAAIFFIREEDADSVDTFSFLEIFQPLSATERSSNFKEELVSC